MYVPIAFDDYGEMPKQFIEIEKRILSNNPITSHEAAFNNSGMLVPFEILNRWLSIWHPELNDFACVLCKHNYVPIDMIKQWLSRTDLSCFREAALYACLSHNTEDVQELINDGLNDPDIIVRWTAKRVLKAMERGDIPK